MFQCPPPPPTDPNKFENIQGYSGCRRRSHSAVLKCRVLLPRDFFNGLTLYRSSFRCVQKQNLWLEFRYLPWHVRYTCARAGFARMHVLEDRYFQEPFFTIFFFCFCTFCKVLIIHMKVARSLVILEKSIAVFMFFNMTWIVFMIVVGVKSGRCQGVNSIKPKHLSR